MAGAVTVTTTVRFAPDWCFDCNRLIRDQIGTLVQDHGPDCPKRATQVAPGVYPA